MGVYIRERGGHWYLDFIYNRTHHMRSLHMRVSKDADIKKKQRAAIEALQLREAQRLHEYKQDLNDLQKFQADYGIIDFDARRRSFKEYALKVAETSKSSRHILGVVRYLEKYHTGGVSIGAIDVDFLEGFKKYLLEDIGMAQQTAHRYFNAFRMVMKRAAGDNIITTNPCDKVRGIPTGVVEKDTLTADEVRRLENTQCEGVLGETVKKAFLFSCNTGLRFSDLQTLEWGNLKQQGREWTLHKKQVKTGGYVDGVLNSTAAELIGAGEVIHFPSERIFTGFDSLSKQSVNSCTNRIIKEWVKRAGIDKTVSWHTARRTFATLLLEAGADVFTTQRLMGHTQIQMTSIYAKSSSEVKARAVKALDALESGEENIASGKARA